ncbi:MAG: S41 family peptidase [Bacteroidota bacterium]
MNDFDLEIVKEQYLSDMQRIESFTVGLLPGNIGYLHIEGFGGLANDFQRSMEEVMAILGETNGLIIDVRGGYGGEDLAGQFIAGHFTETTLPYMQTRIKNGPAEADFTDWMEWEVRPEGTQAYTQPIMVLTHRFTISARETFCMAMKVLPQVQFVGDTTTGAFSNQINRELPNGWGYSVSIGDWRDPDGISYESIGLPPDMVVLNQREELLLGQDHVLEKALEMLE